MPEYLAPGVYVEEISTGPRPIEGVGTSTAGMVGLTERGPERPTLVTGWLHFQRVFGSYVNNSYLAYAVQGFFDNGGQRCFIGRVVGQGDGDAAISATGEVGGLNVSAIGRGTWGNRVRVRVTPVEANPNTPNATPRFNVAILYYTTPPPEPFVDPLSARPQDLRDPNRREPDAPPELFTDLTAIPGDSNNAATIINSRSNLVRVAWPDPAAMALADSGGYVLLEGGAEADAITNDYIGDTNALGGNEELYGRGRGLEGLALVDDIAILLAPDQARAELYDTLTGEVIEQCELLKDRFAVLSAQQGEANVANLRPPNDTLYAGFYYPWITVFDAINNRRMLIPPAGHVAGIMARTDIERGVHKAPANEVVRGALDLEFPITKGMQDLLNPRGVNCIRDFRADGRGIRLWGARTMSSDPMWKYVNVRRLFIFVEESIDQGTQWVVFEPNDFATWAAVARTITNFLTTVWRSGALLGLTAGEAFFVKCDRTTMTQDDIDNGRLICYIGIAPVKPAEFVIFRISQKTMEEAS